MTTIKTAFDLELTFQTLRNDPNHHLGLGDIRLTTYQQEGLVDIFKKREGRINELEKALQASVKIIERDTEIIENTPNIFFELEEKIKKKELLIEKALKFIQEKRSSTPGLGALVAILKEEE